MFTLPNARSAFVLVITLVFSSLSHAAFNSVISFGDSLTDTGNVFTATAGATPAPPYFDGNFTNGPVWVEVMSGLLGVPVTGPSLLSGSNYAWGGAQTTTDNSVPSTASQVGLYLNDVSGQADPNALYTILTGGNDLRAVADPNNAYSFPDLVADAGNVASLANSLLAAGAENILIVNVPDLGLAPISASNPGLATFATTVFNDALLAGLTGLDVMYLDVFATTQEIAADPAAYGFTNISDPCFDAGAGTVCANPEQYLFWDDLHPTAAGQQLIGAAAYSTVVPVPAAAWLFGSALIGLAGLGRRK